MHRAGRRLVDRLRRWLALSAGFQIGREHDLRGKLISPGLSLLFGQLAGTQEFVCFAGRKPLIEVLDRHARKLPQPFSECTGLGRFLTLASMQMHGEAHDKSVDPFFFGERSKILGIEPRGAARVILERTGDSDLGTGERNTDADSSVVDAGDP